jgi:hypothetical protein
MPIHCCCGGGCGGCNSIPLNLTLTATTTTASIPNGTYAMNFGPIPAGLAGLTPVSSTFNASFTSNWWTGPVGFGPTHATTAWVTIFCDATNIHLVAWFVQSGAAHATEFGRWPTFGAVVTSVCSPFSLTVGREQPTTSTTGRFNLVPT